MSTPWLRLDVLPAGFGDALLLRYGSGRDRHTVLVDAGPAEESSWTPVSAALRALTDPIDLFVVTHIDVDHIGAAVTLLGDPALSKRVRAVWFNGFRHLERAGDWLGGIDGELLTTAIRSLGVPWNAGFEHPIDASVGGPVLVPPTGRLPRVPLPGGATAILLSPTPKKLAALKKSWRKTVEDAGLVPGQGAHREPGRRLVGDDWLGDVDLARLAARPTRVDGKAPNGSSIAFVFEWGKRRLLLGADAHPDVVAAGLARLAAEDGTPKVRVDAVKLPHHGSSANLTAAVVDAIDCRDWIVSSNGARFNHPDDVALARVVVGSPAARLHANYDSDRIRAWRALAPPERHGYELVTPPDGQSGVGLSFGPVPTL